MSTLKWMKVKDYNEMSSLAAGRLFDLISCAVKKGRRVNIGMATGNTMIKLYSLLAEKLNASGINLANLYTYNLDEYVGTDGKNVVPSHPLSYHSYMKNNFFSLLSTALNFNMENMRFPDASKAVAYDSEIDNAGGLDFQLLGIGFNGHIAFNEPIGAKEISAQAFAGLPSRVIDLDSLTIETNARLTAGSDLNAVPRKAVTMGMARILKAKEIMLLACFAEQLKPLQAIKTGNVTPELPASFLLQHEKAEIIYTEDKIKFQ